jgi:hypothetical protein
LVHVALYYRFLFIKVIHTDSLKTVSLLFDSTVYIGTVKKKLDRFTIFQRFFAKKLV